MHFEIKIQLQYHAVHHAGHHAVQLNHVLKPEDSIPYNKSKFFLRYHIHIHRTFNDLGPSLGRAIDK